MSSTVIAKNIQIGTSGTATNNFNWYQPASPDGTVRLGVGNYGATTLDAVTVSNTGNVGINNATPGATLDVVGATGVLTRAATTQDAVALVGRAGGTSSYIVTITPTTLTANRTVTLPDNTGTVLTTGATASSVQFGSFGVGTAASGTTGEIRATNNVTAYYSDDRLKTRLGKIENALDKLCSLEGFYYEANETAQALGYEAKREVGVSAQQFQIVMPEIVAPAPIDPKYMTVRYERALPLLIEAIKELREEVRALKG